MSFKMIFGSPGTGKTTYACAIAQKAIKKGITVYTNFPLKGCYKLEVDKIGQYKYSNALCIMDECGIEISNREFKKISKTLIDYMKLARHFRNDWIFLSQGYNDADLKIRTLCTQYYNLRRVGQLTFCREISRRVGIDEISKQVIDEYYKVPLLRGGLHVIFRPRWYKYFDSYATPDIPENPKIPW